MASRVLHSRSGFAMLEAIVGLGIAAVLIVAFQTLVAQSARVASMSSRNLRATMYVREAVEAAKDLEQSNWPVFPVTCPAAWYTYHPQASGGVWTLASGPESLESGIFTRTLTVEPVFRSVLTFPNEIVTSGGECDNNTKKVTASVTWNNGSASEIKTLEAYIYQP